MIIREGLKIQFSFNNFLLDKCIPPYDPPSNLQVLQTVHPAVLRTFLQTVLRTDLRTVLRTVFLIQLCKNPFNSVLLGLVAVIRIKIPTQLQAPVEAVQDG